MLYYTIPYYTMIFHIIDNASVLDYTYLAGHPQLRILPLSSELREVGATPGLESLASCPERPWPTVDYKKRGPKDHRNIRILQITWLLESTCPGPHHHNRGSLCLTFKTSWHMDVAWFTQFVLLSLLWDRRPVMFREMAFKTVMSRMRRRVEDSPGKPCR